MDGNLVTAIRISLSFQDNDPVSKKFSYVTLELVLDCLNTCNDEYLVKVELEYKN